MSYKINELASLSGVSCRTLRYYDSIGLLKPERIDSNGYRIYETKQVDLLHHILIYKELGLELYDIKKAVYSRDGDTVGTLRTHLSSLKEKRARLDEVIANVERTIDHEKGVCIMGDSEKFIGLKNKAIKENREKYGKEVEERFGKDSLEASEKKIAGMSENDWNLTQKLEAEILDDLKIALEKNDPACEEAQRACEKHKQWICMYWKNGTYSKQAHRGLVEGYTYDERFTAYYDGPAGKGATELFAKAIAIYTK